MRIGIEIILIAMYLLLKLILLIIL